VSILKKENISDAVIRRLPRYYRQLTELCNRGIVRISSHSLGQEMNITASQIRQDFSCFGEFGQQGYGYNVEELRAEIGHILCVDNDHHLIMIGVGNLGHALLQNFNFKKVGFHIDSAFDASPDLIGTEIHGVTIRSVDELDAYVEQYHPDVAVLTVPQRVAQSMADRLIALGIRGFWNFTNVELSSADPEVKFENIPFADSLLTLSYRIANR
jgi:redox-sensing transcriptional repressor